MEDKHKNTILIVDSEPKHVNFLVSLLEEKYSLVVANNGHSAITTAMNRRPDIILMGAITSGMTEFEVIAALQHMNETKNIPVILVAQQYKDKEQGFKLKEKIQNEIQTINESLL